MKLVFHKIDFLYNIVDKKKLCYSINDIFRNLIIKNVYIKYVPSAFGM